WAQDFQSRGHSLTNDPDMADMLIVNTCAVTQEAVRKSRQLLRRTHRYNPRAKLVVSGCYSSLDKKTVQDIEGIDLIVDNQDKDNLVEIVLRELPTESMPSLLTQPGELPLFSRGRNRAFIKIQDGCRYQCTFCIVTIARGKERSRTIGDIVHEISRLSGQGVQEAVLTGVHVGGYGSDTGTNLYDLIQAILNDTDIPRLRLASVESWDLPDHFFDLFRNPRLMPHIHLPLQCGSDSVLKRMGRRCMTGDYEKLIGLLRSEVKDINITTDIIVGFPGETENDWHESLEFIEKTGFPHIHIFTYSARPGTKAADLPKQVSSSIKKQRSSQLHALARQMRLDYLNDQIGRQYPVLWETTNQKETDGDYTGFTPNYIRVELTDTSDAVKENNINTVSITGISKSGETATAELR
ncbi:MAG: tRNA (N(6)-L-threonylcarbamoyladenosine(37)-C(2))-methylthiotransferase MtaB, partial [Gammaproteobacteria bacterium]